jgi:hypothetical protein
MLYWLATIGWDKYIWAKLKWFIIIIFGIDAIINIVNIFSGIKFEPFQLGLLAGFNMLAIAFCLIEIIRLKYKYCDPDGW